MDIAQFLRREGRTLLILGACTVAVGMTLLSLFGSTLQQGLAKPVSYATMYPGTGPSPGVHPIQPTGTAIQPIGAVQTPPVFAQDTFQRADQMGWNTASDGHMWQGNHEELMSVQQDVGIITGTHEKVTARLGPIRASADVSVSASLSTFAGGAASFGAMVRYGGTDIWDKAALDGTHLSIIQHSPAGDVTLATMPFYAIGGVSYGIRLQSNGQALLAKAWASGSPEPKGWMMHATDTHLISGVSGIRIILAPDAVVHVSSFHVQAIQ